MVYMKQLDAIRGIAVLAVIYTHVFAEHDKMLPFFISKVYWGGLGVNLFFVLSGFLITGILLSSRDKIHAGVMTASEAIKTFYFRRTLRIFPIYYLTLLVACLLSIPPVRETLLWHVFYLTNVYFVWHGGWNGSIAPLWSLAVEEQFYLIWPWVILFTPRRRLLLVILAVILSAPLFRLYCSVQNLGFGLSNYQPMLLFANTDLLGIGALFALLRREKPHIAEMVANYSLALSAPLFLAFLILKMENMHVVVEPFWFTICGMFFVWIIYSASKGFSGLAGKILGMKGLLYIGKISYGLYLLHYFVHACVIVAFPSFNTYPIYRGMFVTVLSISAAAICFRFIESPFLALKDRANKGQEGSPQVATSEI